MDSIRVLYVEGDPADQEATHRHLVRQAPHIKLTVVGTVAEAIERLTIGDMDVMLADYRLPDGTGLDLLDAVKSRGLEVPVVLVTGSGDADITVRLLKAGATDYLVKRPGYLATLPVVLESAFRWFRAASERRSACSTPSTTRRTWRSPCAPSRSTTRGRGSRRPPSRARR